MKEDEIMERKGSFYGLVPLIVFLIMYIAIGIFTKNFDNLPLLVGLLIASTVGLLLLVKMKKYTFDDCVDMFCTGGGEKTLILMVIIFILAGGFYGVAQKMGAVSTIVNIGLKILPYKLILPGLFMIGCLLSFSMGTSMGTVAALMPVAIEIANKTGVSLALVAGIVVGGAMFGDNLSFISDTTIAATRTQEISMKDKFYTNFYMVLPAVIINIALLFFVKVNVVAINNDSSIQIIRILPYILIIILSLIGMNVLKVMSIGIISGVIIGIIYSDFTFIESFKVVHLGMTWMEDMAIIAIIVGGLVLIMNKLGGIDYLLDKLSKNTKSKKGAELSIALLVSLLDISTTNNTISIIAAGPIARDISDKFGISRRRTASILDIFSSAFNGLLPYAGQLLVAASLAQISPISIMPYNWYSILMIVFGLLFIILELPKYNKKD